MMKCLTRLSYNRIITIPNHPITSTTYLRDKERIANLMVQVQVRTMIIYYILMETKRTRKKLMIT